MDIIHHIRLGVKRFIIGQRSRGTEGTDPARRGRALSAADARLGLFWLCVGRGCVELAEFLKFARFDGFWRFLTKHRWVLSGFIRKCAKYARVKMGGLDF